MRRTIRLFMCLFLAGLLGRPAYRAAAQESQPVVHAVLFYSPTCGHCQYVITEVLPPLFEKYPEQLEIIGLDVTQPRGQEMFMAALQHFGVEQPSVPFLVIDDITLVGSQEIPDQFPTLVESYLATGGISWPDVPGLQELLAAEAQTETVEAVAPGTAAPAATAAREGTSVPLLSPPDESGFVQSGGEDGGWRARFAADPAGNTLSVVVLMGMLASVAWGLMLFRSGRSFAAAKGRRAWIIPIVCLAGLVVAGYLAYVETADVSAVCGPIGDCNTVQQSPYARLFGVLSIGVLGLIGYFAIGSAWALARFSRRQTADLATILLFLMALLGTLFSIYLTFLEPFVIGATCAWCLTSAMLITVLMLVSAGAAGQAFRQVGPGPDLPARG